MRRVINSFEELEKIKAELAKINASRPKPAKPFPKDNSYSPHMMISSKGLNFRKLDL